MKYSDLIVWQESIQLVKKIYLITVQFPDFEKFSLANQLQRAAVAIPSNIAEGHGRKNTKTYIYHLSIASGSLLHRCRFVK